MQDTTQQVKRIAIVYLSSWMAGPYRTIQLEEEMATIDEIQHKVQLCGGLHQNTTASVSFQEGAKLLKTVLKL